MPFKFANWSPPSDDHPYKSLLHDALQLKKKHVRSSFIDEIERKYKSVFKDIWIEHNDLDARSRLQVSAFGAIDGSKCEYKLQAYPAFAVRAVSLLFGKNLPLNSITLEKMDVIVPFEKYEDRIIVYMEGLEAEAYISTLRRIEDIDLMLMDGMFSVASKCKEPLAKYGCDEFEGSLADLLDYVHQMVLEGALDSREVIRLECGWKKNLYKRIAEMANEVLTVYVTKSLLDNGIFKDGLMTDMGILNILARNRIGMTKPRRVSLKVGCKDYAKEITLTRSYMKLSRNGSLLAIEVLGNHDEGSIIEIFNFLRRISLKGYPLPLTQAHKRSTIRKVDCNFILSKALPPYLSWIAKTGREAL